MIKPGMRFAIVKILECSTKGDVRFSALYAKVSVFGKEDSIENHYQLSKRFPEAPKTWREAKGKKAVYLEINGLKLSTNFLTQWYYCLWLKYLDQHPRLVEYAQQFEDFQDFFAKTGTNSQSDVIKMYVRKGRKTVLEYTKEFREILRKNCKYNKTPKGDDCFDI